MATKPVVPQAHVAPVADRPGRDARRDRRSRPAPRPRRVPALDETNDDGAAPTPRAGRLDVVA